MLPARDAPAGQLADAAIASAQAGGPISACGGPGGRLVPLGRLRNDRKVARAPRALGGKWFMCRPSQGDTRLCALNRGGRRER